MVTVLNFALNIRLIAGMRLGAYDAALATAIDQLFSALASLAWLCRGRGATSFAVKIAAQRGLFAVVGLRKMI